MRLQVKFGLIDTKEVNWYRPLEDFPKLISYLGKNYEWVMYDKDPVGRFDQILIFSALSSYDPNYFTYCKTWAELFGTETDDCECGSKYTSFSFDHMRFCRKWRPW